MHTLVQLRPLAELDNVTPRSSYSATPLPLAHVHLVHNITDPLPSIISPPPLSLQLLLCPFQNMSLEIFILMILSPTKKLYKVLMLLNGFIPWLTRLIPSKKTKFGNLFVFLMEKKPSNANGSSKRNTFLTALLTSSRLAELQRVAPSKSSLWA